MVGQFGGLMGKESADAIQGMIKGSNAENNGGWATLIGVGTLLLTASGAFGEIQSSLNKIWKAEPKAGLSRLVRARIAGLGLVADIGLPDDRLAGGQRRSRSARRIISTASSRPCMS